MRASELNQKLTELYWDMKEVGQKMDAMRLSNHLLRIRSRNLEKALREIESATFDHTQYSDHAVLELQTIAKKALEGAKQAA